MAASPRPTARTSRSSLRSRGRGSTTSWHGCAAEHAPSAAALYIWLGQVGFRTSAIGFAIMTGAVTLAAMGIFVLMDPRAQAFWGARIGDVVSFVRSLIPR